MQTKLGSKFMLAAAGVAGICMGLATTAKANLIVNGDFSANASSFTTFPGYTFQSGNPAIANWSTFINSVGVNGPDVSFTPAQPYAPTLDTPGIRDFAVLNNASGAATTLQNVTFAPSTQYTLSFYAADSASFGAAGDTIAPGVSSDGSTFTGGVTPVSLAVFGTDWTFHSFTFTTTAAAGAGFVLFQNSSPTTGVVVDVSNVDLEVVPEPASLGALGLGSIGLLLRRRRKA